MTRKEAIDFGEDRADLFGGKMEEFIKLSVKALKEQRPKGHWIEQNDDYFDWYECSECAYGSEDDEMQKSRVYDVRTNFCPNCGADMREVTE